MNIKNATILLIIVIILDVIFYASYSKWKSNLSIDKNNYTYDNR